MLEEKSVLFVTNNATKSRPNYKKKFDSLGVEAHVVSQLSRSLDAVRKVPDEGSCMCGDRRCRMKSMAQHLRQQSTSHQC